mgnify:CR=1 FL=1
MGGDVRNHKSDKNNRDSFIQDPIQKSIDERLSRIRYEPIKSKKKKYKYEKMQILLAVVMAAGILAGLITIILQIFVK